MSKDDDPAVRKFKEAFKVKPTSTDWKAIMDALAKKLVVLDGYVTTLEGYSSPLAVQARADYNSLVNAARPEQTAFTSPVAKNIKEGAAQRVRDTLLPRLKTYLDQYHPKKSPLQVQVNGAPVKIFWTDIPGFAGLPQNQRQTALTACAQKVADGKALFNQIMQGHVPAVPPTQKNVTDLIWALKSAAQELDQGPYEKGAMVVPIGANDALRAWLDTSPDVYPRASSHLKEQQTAKNGHSPRGMDFYNGAATLGQGQVDGLLPSGMNTLLFQQVTTSDGTERLYLKMETEGAFGSGGGNTAYDPTAPVGRAQQPHDNGALLAHGANFVKAKLGMHDQDPELRARREDIGKKLKKACEGLIKVAPVGTRAGLTAALGNKLEGIGGFIAKLAVENASGTINLHGPAMKDTYERFHDLLAELMGPNWTDPTVYSQKFGEEATLTANQL
jgi:hypothetical protein